jgi:hypothetical protein
MINVTKEDLDWVKNNKKINFKPDGPVRNGNRLGDDLSQINEMGYFGNIWVRSHYMKDLGQTNGEGHYHKFDHVSLLVKGSIRLEVEGFKPTRYTAPTFVIIKKEHKHKIIALEDETIYFCVFALRDIDGNITDIYNGNNSPYGIVMNNDLNNLEKQTVKQ